MKTAYKAMADPRWVMAVGTCAVSGGISGGNYASGTGLEGVLPVDVYLPGCPPNPAAGHGSVADVPRSRPAARERRPDRWLSALLLAAAALWLAAAILALGGVLHGQWFARGRRRRSAWPPAALAAFRMRARR